MKTNTVITEKIIEELCTAGGLAPSGGNIQPWHVVAYNDRLEVTLDPKRSVSLLDIGKYASVFSLGSFVENVAIAAQGKNISYEIEIIKKAKPDFICIQFRFSHISTKEPKLSDLYPFLASRMTSRTMSDGTIIPESEIDRLLALFEHSQETRLALVSSQKGKKQIADILGKGDVVRTLNDPLFAQMMKELRFTKEDIETTLDGMDVATLELPGNVAKMLQLMEKFPSIRTVIPRNAFEDMAKPLLLSSSHIGCLTLTKPLTVDTLFTAGRLMQRLWLKATQMGIHIHPWTVLTFFIMRVKDQPGTVFSSKEAKELVALDAQLRDVFSITNKETPFFLFRIYRGSTSKHRSLRLRWDTYTDMSNFR